MPSTAPRLLVVDDAPDVAQVVAVAARMGWPGCRVSVAVSGAEALRRFTS